MCGAGCLTVNGIRPVEYVRWLLEEGAPVDGTDGDTTPLILAAGMSDAESVRVLLEHGASVEARTEGRGETALHVAARELSVDVVRLLIAAGARVDARDSSGGTVLHALAGEDNNGLEDPKLPEMLRLLIAHGADVAARDDEGHTALDFAVRAALSADVIALLR
jgi:ankyrin repeat protein